MKRDKSSATQEPTIKKLRTAREEGNVARSADLTTVLFLIIASVLVFMWTPKMFVFCRELLVSNLSGNKIELFELVEQTGWEVFYIALLPCIVLFVGALIAGFIQVGGLFAPKVVGLRWSRIAFSNGSNLIGSRGQMTFVFSITKLFLASGASLLVLLHCKEDLLDLGNSNSLVSTITVAGTIGMQVVFSALLVLLLLGLLDLFWQRYAWKRDLRMSRQEIIEEHRENSGNASIIRRQTAWFAKKCAQQVVPSLVVVGNKLAVAIRWNAVTMSSPIVLDVYKGDDFLEHVSNSSKSSPVVKDNILATKIVGMSDIGLGIPPTLHGEIASLLIMSRRVER
jgi:flagellar biosynthetic protein FlhB